VSRKTLLNILGTLSSMLGTAKKWGYTTEGVDRDALEFPTRQVRTAVRFFSAEETRKMIAAAEQPWRTMYAIAAMTGVRCGELLGLSIDDLDFERKEIHVRRSVWRGKIQTPKSAASEGVLPMPEALAVMLKTYVSEWRPNPLRLLFVNERGNPFIGENVVRDRLAPLLEELGFPARGLPRISPRSRKSPTRIRSIAGSDTGAAASFGSENHARNLRARFGRSPTRRGRKSRRGPESEGHI
jgi:integrase